MRLLISVFILGLFFSGCTVKVIDIENYNIIQGYEEEVEEEIISRGATWLKK